MRISLKMLNFSVRCVVSSAKVDKLLFTFAILRNYKFVSLQADHRAYTTLNHQGDDMINNSKDGVQPSVRSFSRFAASTIMPHFKEFRLTDYDIIGFDLDGTLLRYNLNNMVPLEYELLTNYLVENKNYPRTLLTKKFDNDFVQKGLIIDAERGNILKLSSDGIILKATHGTRFLSNVEIEGIYGKSKKWDIAQEYMKDPLSAWNGPVSEKLRTLLDYFDIASSLVFARAVDSLDEVTGTKNVLHKQDYSVWSDILSGLIQIYTREHFASGESQYFEALKHSPESYILKTNDKVINRLKELRSSGKALYLLTGSNIDFADFTASYALGPKWRELFNCVISFAKKPGFFHMQRQFLKVNNLEEVPGSEISLTDDLLRHGSNFSQGNWLQLKESLSNHVLHKDANEARCLYVGDNLIQDVYAPFTGSSMDTIALSEELLEYDNNFEFKGIVQSSLWGSYFSVDGTPTFWSQTIEKYSHLCISHMDIVADVPVKEKIHCENKEGFFPKMPESLLVR